MKVKFNQSYLLAFVIVLFLLTAIYMMYCSCDKKEGMECSKKKSNPVSAATLTTSLASYASF